MEKKATYFARVVFEISWEYSVEMSERHLDIRTQNSGIWIYRPRTRAFGYVGPELGHLGLWVTRVETRREAVSGDR